MNNTEKSNDIRQILSKDLSDYELHNLLTVKRTLRNDIERLFNKEIDLNTLRAIQYLLQQA